MALMLYDITVPLFLQSLGAVAGLIDKAEACCSSDGIAPAEMMDARLAPDMLPFAYQVKSTAVHSIGAIEGVKRGTFSPDTSLPPDSFEGLRGRISEATAALQALGRDEVNALEGGDMRFEFGEYRIDFTAENFLLSFSKPNFYFHVTTAYDILRSRGIGIGKRDYMGQLLTKG